MANQKEKVKLYSDVPYENFVYTTPRRNASGGFNCYINASEGAKKSPTFQLPKCKAKFGMNQAIGESTRRNLDVSVDDADVQTFFTKVDGQNIGVAAQKSKTFFKKELSPEILSMTLHRKTLKYDDEKKYDPLLRLKCNPSGKNKTKVYVVTLDENGEEQCHDGTLDSITPWSEVVPIVQLGGLWFTSTQFGMSVNAVAIMVWPEESASEIEFNGLNIKKRKISEVSTPSDPAASAPVTTSSSSGVPGESAASPFDDDVEIM